MNVKRHPVVWVMSMLAGLNAVLALGTLQDLVPPVVMAWVLIASAALQAGVQFWVRAQVTPLAYPRDDQGRELVAVNRRGFPFRLPGIE